MKRSHWSCKGLLLKDRKKCSDLASFCHRTSSLCLLPSMPCKRAVCYCSCCVPWAVCSSSLSALCKGCLFLFLLPRAFSHINQPGTSWMWCRAAVFSQADSRHIGQQQTYWISNSGKPRRHVSSSCHLGVVFPACNLTSLLCYKSNNRTISVHILTEQVNAMINFR
jgi:hypothetical protein